MASVDCGERQHAAATEWPPLHWMRRPWAPATLPEYRQDRRTVCYHEAAHAVLGVLFDFPIGAAHVYEDVHEGETINWGKVEVTPRQPRDMHAPIPPDVMEAAGVRLAVFYVGGIAAELLLHGFEVRGWLDLKTPDWRNARKVLLSAFGHDWALFYCQQVAAAILSENWAWVGAVACVLEGAGTLSAQEVRLLCPVASPDC